MVALWFDIVHDDIIPLDAPRKGLFDVLQEMKNQTVNDNIDVDEDDDSGDQYSEDGSEYGALHPSQHSANTGPMLTPKKDRGRPKGGTKVIKEKVVGARKRVNWTKEEDDELLKAVDAWMGIGDNSQRGAMDWKGIMKHYSGNRTKGKCLSHYAVLVKK